MKANESRTMVADRFERTAYLFGTLLFCLVCVGSAGWADDLAPATTDDKQVIATLRRAHNLRSDDRDAFLEALQSVAGELPEVPVATETGAPRPVPYRFNAFDQQLDAVRFRVPEGQPRDLVWRFFMTPKGQYSWYIEPVSGRMEKGFSNHHYIRELAPDPDSKTPEIGKRVGAFQFLAAENLRPGTEYVLWFDFTDPGSCEMEVSVACLPAGQVENTLLSLARALNEESAAIGSKQKWIDWWMEQYTLAGGTDPQWDDQVLRGVQLWMLNDKRSAVEIAAQALEAGCGNPVVRFMYARNLYVLKENGNAVKQHLQAALAAMGDREDLEYLRGYCLNILAFQHMRDDEVSLAVQAWEAARQLKISDDIRAEVEKNLAKARSRHNLMTISLADAPASLQVHEYIRQIAEASRGGPRARRDDPQNKLFDRIGREHLEVLLRNLGDDDVNYYIRMRIHEIVTEEDKAKILEWLEYEPHLVDVVTERGWVSDAKPTLVKVLAERPRYLPAEWIRAVSHMKDPSTCHDLRWYFVNGYNRYRTYYSIKDVPGIGIDQALVHEAWKKAISWERPYLAAITLDHGVVEALGYVVGRLSDPWSTKWVGATPQELILRYTGVRGSDNELRQWYDESKDRLVFDAEAKQFRVQ